MKKLVRVYVAVCVIGINVLLLLAVTNCAALYYHRHSDKAEERSPHIAQILAEQPQLLKLIYPDLTVDQVRVMLHEIWDLVPEYELFTQFREQPFRGEFVNVDEHGFRHIENQGPWPPDPDHFVLFMFGGSTTFGYGVADHQTVPSHLQSVLRETPISEKTISVYNWGRGGYYSSQERALFAVLLLQGHVPDVAVFMDGLNDFGSFWRERAYAATFHNLMAAHAGDQFVSSELLSSLPLVKWLAGTSGTAPAELILPGEIDAEFVVDRYLANKKILGAVCAAHDVVPLFVWQPVQHYEYYPLTVKQVVDVQDLGRNTYARMKMLHGEGKTGADFLWLAELQAQAEFRQQFVYVDAFHYTSGFGRAIAAAIADALRR